MTIPDRQNYKILLRRKIGDLTACKALYRAGNWSQNHFHENARIVFVLNGSFVEKYETKQRFCQPFTSIFRPPMEKHSEVYEPGVVCLGFDLSSKWIKKLEDFSVKLDRSEDFHNPSLNQLITKICGELTFNDDVSNLAIESLLNEVAVEMHRNLSDSEFDKSPRWLKTAEEYIRENFSENLTLTKIADEVGVHPVHLARVFKRKYHLTIAEYIRRLRVESACRLLTHSDLKLSEISLETGFNDQSHFTKIFKTLMGKTPSEFKRIHRKVV